MIGRSPVSHDAANGNGREAGSEFWVRELATCWSRAWSRWQQMHEAQVSIAVQSSARPQITLQFGGGVSCNAIILKSRWMQGEAGAGHSRHDDGGTADTGRPALFIGPGRGDSTVAPGSARLWAEPVARLPRVVVDQPVRQSDAVIITARQCLGESRWK